MKISYAITVCNEHKELDKLLKFLFENKGDMALYSKDVYLILFIFAIFNK